MRLWDEESMCKCKCDRCGSGAHRDEVRKLKIRLIKMLDEDDEEIEDISR